MTEVTLRNEIHHTVKCLQHLKSDSRDQFDSLLLLSLPDVFDAFQQGVRVERNAINPLLNKELGKFGEVAWRLATQTNLPSGCLRFPDHGAEHLHGRVIAFIK